MPIPSSGPLAMSLFADEVGLPLSSVSLNQQKLRDLAQKSTQDSKFSFSDFYDKGTYQEYTIGSGFYEDGFIGINPVNVNGVDQYFRLWGYCDDFRGDIPRNSISPGNLAKGLTVHALGFCQETPGLRAWIGAIIEGSVSPLVFPSIEVWYGLNGSKYQQGDYIPIANKFVAASGSVPAYTFLAWQIPSYFVPADSAYPVKIRLNW